MKKYLTLSLILSFNSSYSMLRRLAQAFSTRTTISSKNLNLNRHRFYASSKNTFLESIQNIPSHSNYEYEINAKIQILKRCINDDLGLLEVLRIKANSPESYYVMIEIKHILNSGRCSEAKNLVNKLLSLKESI